jgi:hypothetical protein
VTSFGIGLWLLFWIVVGVAVVIAIVMSFFLRRHGEQERPQAHWLRTDEVFVDPTTDRLMRVWVEPGAGERHYVPDAR